VELLTPLRILARRRLMVALGALLAAALGLAASGNVAVGPFGAQQLHSGLATANIQIDTPRPLAVDARARAAIATQQAMMLAERLSADTARAAIARRADVPFDELAVLSSRTAIVGRTSPVARAAVDAASSLPSRYRLTVSSTSDAPIISLLAAAPDVASARRLAAAAAPAVANMIAAAPDTVWKRLEVKPLARPDAVAVDAGGPKPLLGVVAALIVFVGWCWGLVVAGGMLRAWRGAPSIRPAGARS
jgi:hypothetical protein